jgi:hypothetical protein
MQRHATLLYHALHRRPEQRTGVCLVMIFMALYAVIASRLPDGGWDAWAIWNLRAKFIASGSLRVPDYYSHPDYPPLVPLVIGGLWRIVGYTVLVPQAVHGATFAAVLWIVRRRWIAVGFVGAVGLQFAPQQYADTPLALTTLCATVAYINNRAGWGGLSLGAGMLIKNEGVIIALVFGGLWAVRDWRVLVSLLPCAALLVAYRLYINAPNDIMSAPGNVYRATDPARYYVVITQCARGLIQFGHFAIPCMIMVTWLSGIKIKMSLPVIACGLILACYGTIYIITPYDIGWHIHASWHRLIWHVTPAFIYGVYQ